ncbi:MAG TPA: transaldolase [Streptosporangiaceae bacterium]|nr:transaldolase [Streptosporangiaceae bacterium]
MTTQPDDKLGQLSALGVAVWLDDISRERLRTGNLAALMRDFHVVGVTSNPTIFASALSKGDAYDEQIADLQIRDVTLDEASRAITTYDIRWAADVLRPAYDASGGLDGRVSIEVDPRIARDSVKTIAEAKALWWAVDRPNMYIKIPATTEGLPAITQTLAQGISVNVTLIFSLERYGEVIDAYMAGLEAADAAGHDLCAIASVASFFVSRVDTEVDGRLEKIGSADALALRGRAAIENARLAYELFEQRSATSRWAALQGRGARPQRPLWASTSTKNPAYKDTMYVTDLVAAGTVNTMPEPTLHAIAGHGDVRGDTIHGTYDGARRYFEQLAAVGVSYDDVVQVLEDEGVEKFATSWNQLLDTIKSEMAAKGSL